MGMFISFEPEEMSVREMRLRLRKPGFPLRAVGIFYDLMKQLPYPKRQFSPFRGFASAYGMMRAFQR